MSNVHRVHRSRTAAKMGYIHVRGFVRPDDAAKVLAAIADADREIEADIADREGK